MIALSLVQYKLQPAEYQHQFPSSQRISLTFNLIISSFRLLGLPTLRFPRGFPTKILYAFLVPPLYPYAKPIVASNISLS
jgi:hypothetical protein